MDYRVYFNEFNLRMGKMCYLPLVSGLLRSYAETMPEIVKNFRFMPFIYHIDSLPNIMAQYAERPHVAAFSVSMWNEQLNLEVAGEVKKCWPDCLIVFGGPQVPHDPTEYMREHKCIDVAVRAEGEEAFAEILQRYLDGGRYHEVPAVSFRDANSGEILVNRDERPYKRDLDDYPSPYLEGLYDDLIAAQSDTLEFQAIIETNRGCPFLCTFCYWGRGGLTRKYRYHDMDRVYAEIDWCGRNGIRYVFNADSNFGMHSRDQEIAKFIVETKRKYKFPEKFRTCFGKNTDEKIYQIGVILHSNDLEKGITLARQSNDKKTLKNIKRSNIKMETYQNLQQKFNDKNIPIYSELILGLPGETVDSWKRGIDELLLAGLNNQLFMYLCQVFPNTEMGDPDYQRQHGIVTKRIELNEIHGSVRDREWVKEYEDIIIATDSMIHEEWQAMVKFSWISMLFHSMKVGYFIIVYLSDRFSIRPSDFLSYVSERGFPQDKGRLLRRELAEYDQILNRMIDDGVGRGKILDGYGSIYWDIEEASFLAISEYREEFYAELGEVVIDFLEKNGVEYDEGELREVLIYQKLRIPTQSVTQLETFHFSFNFPEYFNHLFGIAPVALRRAEQGMTVTPRNFGDDRERFARETILWGRKSGTMLTDIAYTDAIPADVVKTAI